jgi:hypothetical protein
MDLGRNEDPHNDCEACAGQPHVGVHVIALALVGLPFVAAAVIDIAVGRALWCWEPGQGARPLRLQLQLILLLALLVLSRQHEQSLRGTAQRLWQKSGIRENSEIREPLLAEGRSPLKKLPGKIALGLHPLCTSSRC